jgi:hypothetical protein
LPFLRSAMEFIGRLEPVDIAQPVCSFNQHLLANSQTNSPHHILEHYAVIEQKGELHKGVST